MDLTNDQLIRRANKLKAARANWDSHWDELAHYVKPRSKQFVARRTSGEKLPTTVYDSTARESLQIMAAGFLGQLTNRATEWFDLRTQDPALMKAPGVKEWLVDSRRKILDVLNGSNFYQELHELMLDLGGFGTACFYSEEDVIDIVRFYARSVREIVFTENANGRVNAVWRFLTYTTEQAYELWGKNAGATVVKAFEDKKFDDEHEFLHCVLKRGAYDPGKKDGRNMAWASVWLNVKDRKRVQEGGYEEFPFNVVRFVKETPEVYGYCPAMDCLPEIKSANSIKRTMIRGGSKQVDPPLEVPSEGYLLKLNMNPSGINYRKRGLAADDRITPIQTGGQLVVGEKLLEMEQVAIKRAFFVDFFMTLAQRDSQMTAREVVERVAEKALILGPVIGRIMTELLDPMINRTFHILSRAGIIPPAPEGLETYTIEYVSRLAKAQKFAEVEGLQQFVLMVSGIAQISPDVVDKVDADKIVDVMADLSGVDPKIIREDEKIKEIREAREQAKQQQMQMEAAERMAKAGQSAGQAANAFAAAGAQGAGQPA